jgi:hypothetical protein
MVSLRFGCGDRAENSHHRCANSGAVFAAGDIHNTLLPRTATAILRAKADLAMGPRPFFTPLAGSNRTPVSFGWLPTGSRQTPVLIKRVRHRPQLSLAWSPRLADLVWRGDGEESGGIGQRGSDRTTGLCQQTVPPFRSPV